MGGVHFGGLLIVVAAAFGAPLLLVLVPSFRLPAVILEIIAGIVLGPSVLGWVRGRALAHDAGGADRDRRLFGPGTRHLGCDSALGRVDADRNRDELDLQRARRDVPEQARRDRALRLGRLAPPQAGEDSSRPQS